MDGLVQNFSYWSLVQSHQYITHSPTEVLSKAIHILLTAQLALFAFSDLTVLRGILWFTFSSDGWVKMAI